MYWIEQLVPHNFGHLAILFLLLLALVTTITVLIPDMRKTIAWGFRDYRLAPHYLVFIGAISFLGFILLGYSYLVEPNLLEVNRQDYDIEKVSLNVPIRVVVIGDLQYKGVISPSYVKYVVQEVNRQSPDLVFWVGDLIESDAQELVDFSELANIKARYGKYAVMGNHDYRNVPRETVPDFLTGQIVSDFLSQSGFFVLSNTFTTTSIEGVVVGIAGSDSSWYGLQDYQSIAWQSQDKSTAFNLLLTHEPASVMTSLNPELFDLTFAGHCHGGQVNLGIINQLLDFPPAAKGCVKEGYRVDGFFDINNHKVYVTKGLGTASLPIRFGSKPEISVIDLY